jgi:4-oxalomesaconate tautomerase
MQLAIPYMHFRGKFKRAFFLKKDLPEDENLRNQYLIAAIEGTTQGDSRQIDGLGGGSSLSSKIAIVSPSSVPEADLDYFLYKFR